MVFSISIRNFSLRLLRSTHSQAKPSPRSNRSTPKQRIPSKNQPLSPIEELRRRSGASGKRLLQQLIESSVGPTASTETAIATASAAAIASAAPRRTNKNIANTTPNRTSLKDTKPTTQNLSELQHKLVRLRSSPASELFASAKLSDSERESIIASTPLANPRSFNDKIPETLLRRDPQLILYAHKASPTRRIEILRALYKRRRTHAAVEVLRIFVDTNTLDYLHSDDFERILAQLSRNSTIVTTSSKTTGTIDTKIDSQTRNTTHLDVKRCFDALLRANVRISATMLMNITSVAATVRDLPLVLAAVAEFDDRFTSPFPPEMLRDVLTIYSKHSSSVIRGEGHQFLQGIIEDQPQRIPTSNNDIWQPIAVKMYKKIGRWDDAQRYSPIPLIPTEITTHDHSLTNDNTNNSVSSTPSSPLKTTKKNNNKTHH